MESHIFIAPPGAGKTTFKREYPGVFVDPEESIDWKRMHKLHSLYKEIPKRCFQDAVLEHELDWPTVWVKEILPRMRAAILLGKDILMGMLTPSSAEITSKIFQAFQKNTTVVLPEEEVHFQRVWGHELKRARTWGPELRGWQHTFWIRLLLKGFAENLGLNIDTEFRLPGKNTKRKEGLTSREATGDNRKKFIEVLFGRWAELNEHEEIVAMYLETAINEKGIHIKCDRTGKVCGKGLHNCEKTILINNDVNGGDIRTWIAQDKIKPYKKGHTKNALIFFVGTLAPFHHGHLDVLNSAKSFLEKEGWNVIGGYASPFANIKEGRADSLHSILSPVNERSNMLQLGVMQSDWLMADFPTDHVLRLSLLEQGRHPIQFLAKRLREHGALTEKDEVTTFWINGSDGYLDQNFFGGFSKYAEADKMNPLRIFVMDNRPSKDEWSKKNLASLVPSLLPFVVHHKLHQINPTSATKIRETLVLCNRKELKEYVGIPLVEAYLMGLMNSSVVGGNSNNNNLC